MTEPLKRRSLFPVASSAEPPPPPEAIAAVAVRNGFAEAEPRPAAPPVPSPEAEQGTGRRRRQPTGRDHAFTTRLRQDTLDAIYAHANERNIPLAQVIEEAILALQAQNRHA